MLLAIYRNKKIIFLLVVSLSFIYFVVFSSKTDPVDRDVKESLVNGRRLSPSADIHQNSSSLPSVKSARNLDGASKTSSTLKKTKIKSIDETVYAVDKNDKANASRLDGEENERNEEEKEIEVATSDTQKAGVNFTTAESVNDARRTERSFAFKAPQGGTVSPSQFVYTLKVGFVERRKHWVYNHTFDIPASTRICRCPDPNVGNVSVVLEQNLTNLKEYDVLIFVHDVGQIPITSSMWQEVLSSAQFSQRRVYASVDGVTRVRYLDPPEEYKEMAFHWSMTYHSKSDFVTPYGVYRPHDRDHTWNDRRRNWAEGKTGLVAWMSSSSTTAWKRTEWVKSLHEQVGVDIYGDKFKGWNRNGTDSSERIIKKYKFYLALESNCCDEFITEKFWRSLSLGVVPVVVGPPREDYERLAPPNSFIYGDDFGSARELADYLKKLDLDDDLYNDFFEWRSLGEVILTSTGTGSRVAKTNLPAPDGNLYSCRSVCRVAKRYRHTVDAELSSFPTFFDPDANWWGGSCGTCGSHEWLKDFQGE